MVRTSRSPPCSADSRNISPLVDIPDPHSLKDICASPKFESDLLTPDVLASKRKDGSVRYTHTQSAAFSVHCSAYCAALHFSVCFLPGRFQFAIAGLLPQRRGTPLRDARYDARNRWRRCRSPRTKMPLHAVRRNSRGTECGIDASITAERICTRYLAVAHRRGADGLSSFAIPRTPEARPTFLSYRLSVCATVSIYRCACVSCF